MGLAGVRQESDERQSSSLRIALPQKWWEELNRSNEGLLTLLLLLPWIANRIHRESDEESALPIPYFPLE